ncbi:two-component system response regulator [Marinobacterium zhoushanense]|uniref:Two-component system response regulator n=2 Tax=Marinobacterium zhoushanense TaxID=1679163 RepID=A0ABQ1KPP9_9GAMM|nr:two-component system response regulator [Marinobacterium zhoushanense]
MGNEGLSVMLVDDETERAAMVEQELQAQGYTVVCRLTTTAALRHHVERVQPDIVIIDMDSPDRDTLEHMSVVNQQNPRPIVFFADKDDNPDNIRAAIKAGVSAYIVDGLKPNRVKPILDVAIARFEEFQSLRSELLQTRTELDDRKVIEKAKGMLMKHQGCDEEQAFRTLRKLAMDRSQKLVDVARSVIKVLEVL